MLEGHIFDRFASLLRMVNHNIALRIKGQSQNRDYGFSSPNIYHIIIHYLAVPCC